MNIKQIIMENITEKNNRKIFIVSSKSKLNSVEKIQYAVKSVTKIMKKYYPDANITVVSDDDDYLDLSVYGDNVDLSQAVLSKGKIEKEITDSLSLPVFVSFIMS